MFFSVVTKNWTFKRWDGVKDEKFKYYEGSLKNPIFRKGNEKPIYRRELPKKCGMVWTVCRFKGGGLGEKEAGGIFEGVGWYPNAGYAPPIFSFIFFKFYHLLSGFSLLGG